MPKRGDLIVLEALCEGAMEGLKSGSKYFVRVAENKLTVTPNDILDMEDLACLVANHLHNNGKEIDIYWVRNLKDACEDWLEVKEKEILSNQLVEDAAKTIVEEMMKEEEPDIEAWDGKYGLQEGQ